MTASLSIVVPTLNAELHLPGCLSVLVEGVLGGLVRELIVSDGGSEDQTLQIADNAGALIVRGAASRGAQLRRGADAARGDWLLFLHADTVLDVEWSLAVGEHLRNQNCPAYFPLAFDQSGLFPWTFAGWANLRSQAFGLPYGDQGLLVSRADYDRVGGFPDQPLMEDVAIARALGRPLMALSGRAVTRADRYRRAGWVRRGIRNQWTLIRYFAGADPAALEAAYRR